MSTFTNIDLETLRARKDKNCISIYMPTHPKGVDEAEDRKRLEHLLDEAEKRLRDSGLDGPVIQKLLAPARVTMNFDSFWKNMSDGLAMYIGPDTASYYNVPIPFQEQLVVSDHFILEPMIPLVEIPQHDPPRI